MRLWFFWNSEVINTHTDDLALPLGSFFAKIDQVDIVVFLDIVERELLPVDQTVEVAVDAVAVRAHESEEFGGGRVQLPLD